MKKTILPFLLLALIAGGNLHCTRKGTPTVSVSTDASPSVSSGASNASVGNTGSAANSPVVAPTSEYPAYVGRYKMQSDDLPYITILIEDNRLYGQADNQPKAEISYESRDHFTFQIPNASGTVIFNRDSGQQVTGMTVVVNGYEVKGAKIKQ